METTRVSVCRKEVISLLTHSLFKSYLMSVYLGFSTFTGTYFKWNFSFSSEVTVEMEILLSGARELVVRCFWSFLADSNRIP